MGSMDPSGRASSGGRPPGAHPSSGYPYSQDPGGARAPHPGVGASPPPGAWGEPPPEGSSRRGRSFAAKLAAGLAGLVLLVGGVGINVGWGLAIAQVAHSVAAAQSGIHALSPVHSSSGQTGQKLSAQAIASKVEPAVVDINTVIGSGGRSAQAAGTGMVVTPSGAVLTNNHVIEGATAIEVTLPNQSRAYQAKVLGANPSSDVALIQIQGVSGLPAVTMGDSSSLTIGEGVIAIGNALGQGGSPTVTQGTITALNRSITVGNGRGGGEELTGLIESNAPISPGDSGGPLVNQSGQVVGMITAGATQGYRQTTSTDGYAIPTSTASPIVSQILAGQSSSAVRVGPQGYLGVQVQSLDARTAARLGLSVGSGALVSGVVSGSPAAQAGITPGSVITAIGDVSITSTSSLGMAIQSHKPGDRVQVGWVDQSGSHRATVSLMASSS